MPRTKASVLVLCAHSDDQVLGCGGTLMKHARQGVPVNVIIFSYGEKSHPWLKKQYIADIRVRESLAASKIMGVRETLFFNLEEGHFRKDIQRKHVAERLTRLFRKYRPTKIFTHAIDDPLPDHNQLGKFVTDFCDLLRFPGDLYCFEVWNPVNVMKRDLPRVVVDISDEFSAKVKALRCFKSQSVSMLSLLWSVYWRALRYGWKNNCKYAEVFYKAR